MANRDTKHRRMQVRKDIGNRVIEEPGPRLNGPAYLMPMACFNCTKSWKRSLDSSHVCPECGGTLAEMGRNFSAPKHSDKDQWKKVELLWLAGFRFVGSSRNHGGEPLPANLKEVEQFLRENSDHPFRVALPRSTP